jgi:hypothetical protein
MMHTFVYEPACNNHWAEAPHLLVWHARFGSGVRLVLHGAARVLGLRFRVSLERYTLSATKFRPQSLLHVKSCEGRQ